MNFESLRHEISHCVHASRDPLSAPQLMEMCELAENETQLANALYNMSQADQIAKHPAPEGSGRVKFLYGPGKVKLGAMPPQNDAGGGDRTARQSPVKKPRKVRAVKPSKKQRKNARRSPSSAVLLMKKETVYGVLPHRWALTSDGAFILLGTQTEIQKPAARALVDFVRTLDAGTA